MSSKNLIRMIFIDDEMDLRELAVLHFENRGFDIMTAENGKVGLEYIRKQKFDVIVTDIDMPELDGIDVMIQTKGSELNNDTELFVLSANINDEVTAKASELRILNLIPKPCLMETLEQEILKKVSPGGDLATYDPRIKEAFVTASCDIIEHYFGERPKVTGINIRNRPVEMGYVTCTLALYGQNFQGSLVTLTDVAFLEEFGRILLRDKQKFLNKVLMCDISREFCNQIGGRVQRIFKRHGLEFDMLLPHVFCGGGQIGPLPTENNTLSVSLTVRNVPCTIEFSLTDIPAGRIRDATDDPVDADVTFL